MIEAVNLTARTALTDDGEAIPITQMLDANGDQTEAPSEAVAVVAGRFGQWFCVDLRQFEGATTQ